MDQSRHGEGLTSVKVHHQPGGASSFSLGGNYYGEDEQPVNRNRRPGQPQGVAGAVNPSEEDKEQEQQQQ